MDMSLNQVVAIFLCDIAGVAPAHSTIGGDRAEGHRGVHDRVQETTLMERPRKQCFMGQKECPNNYMEAPPVSYCADSCHDIKNSISKKFGNRVWEFNQK